MQGLNIWQRGQKKKETPSFLFTKRTKSWIIKAVPETKSLLIPKQMAKGGFFRLKISDTRLYVTVRSARQNQLVPGQGRTWTGMFYNEKFLVFINSIFFYLFSNKNFREIRAEGVMMKKNLIESNFFLPTLTKVEYPGLVQNKHNPAIPGLFVQLFVNFWNFLSALGDFMFQKLVINQLFGCNFFNCSRSFMKLSARPKISTPVFDNEVFLSNIRPYETGKAQPNSIWSIRKRFKQIFV